MNVVMEAIRNIFAYEFLLRAVIVGTLISVCAALLGVSLVLKRFSMMGDGLSHIGFGALAVSVAFGVSSMAVSLPVVIAVAFLMLWLGDKGKMRGDALIGLMSTGALAIGVMVVSISGTNVNLMDFLFGSVFALTQGDVYISLCLAIPVLVLFVLFYHKIFAVTFDGGFARATGIRTGLYTSLIAILTAVTIVIGMRFMGALLISGLVVFPPLTAMQLCKKFRNVVLCAAALSGLSFFLGMVLCVAIPNCPAGAGVICVNLVLFLLFSLLARVRRLVAKD